MHFAKLDDSPMFRKQVGIIASLLGLCQFHIGQWNQILICAFVFGDYVPRM
jgi:hypothetical protein